MKKIGKSRFLSTFKQIKSRLNALKMENECKLFIIINGMNAENQITCISPRLVRLSYDEQNTINKTHRSSQSKAKLKTKQNEQKRKETKRKTPLSH